MGENLKHRNPVGKKKMEARLGRSEDGESGS